MTQNNPFSVTGFQIARTASILIILCLVFISGCNTASTPMPAYIRFYNFKEYSEYKVGGMTKEYIDERGKIAMSNTIE